MNKLITFILILILFSCSDNTNVEKIEYNFYPAFLSPIAYKIDINSKTLSQESIKTEYSSIYDNRLLSKDYKIKENHLNLFIAQIEASKLDSSLVHKISVLDGIGFKFNSINKKNDTISLISVSPSRTEENKIDYIILDAFFQLANTTIDDYKGISHVENIQDYFSYGLPIKKMSDSPLEYRVWGSVTGCKTDNPELISFLDSLPNNKPVILDLRNGSFAPCLSDLIVEYIDKKVIYCYGDFELIKLNQEIEILQKNLEIAEKDNNSSKVRKLNVNLRLSLRFKEDLINSQDKRLYAFPTKNEVLKTIANNVYN